MEHLILHPLRLYYRFMDKEDESMPESKGLVAGFAFEPTEAQRGELSRRSAAHRQNPDEAIPLEDALQSLERSLGY